jgi:hypothetical protein
MPKKSLKIQRKQRVSKKRIGKRRTIRGGFKCLGSSCMTSIPVTPPEELAEFNRTPPIFGKPKKLENLLENFLTYIRNIKSDTQKSSNELECIDFCNSIIFCCWISTNQITPKILTTTSKNYSSQIILCFLQNEENLKHYFSDISMDYKDYNDYTEIGAFITYIKKSFEDLTKKIISEENSRISRTAERKDDNRF